MIADNPEKPLGEMLLGIKNTPKAKAMMHEPKRINITLIISDLYFFNIETPLFAC
jgi:hypothetical protein